jgi:integrase
VRTRELEDFVEQIEKHCGHRGQPPANSTVNRYLDAASKVLTYAHKLEMIQGRPSFPRRDNNDGQKRGALTWAQEDTICGWLEANESTVDAYLIRILCGTGMRAGELDAITASQIETPEQRENSGIQLRGDQTKNGHPRWVPLVPEACQKLRAIIVAGRRTIQHNLYESMKRAVKGLGENPKISPHWCRHTFNTRANDQHANHLDVAEIVGHLDGSMSQLYYHPNKAKLFAVAEKVQNRLGETQEKSGIIDFASRAKQAVSA